MSYGFEIGRSYKRVADIHKVFGGSQQGGIITTNGPNGTKGPIFIVTGNSGLKHGYDDRWRADGVFEYFGEGQTGDMQMRKGNKAIATHAEIGRSLLLFKREKKQAIQFQGEFICETHHIERAPDKTKRLRDAIVFELRSLAAVVEAVDAAPIDLSASLDELRRRAHEAAGTSPPKQGKVPRNIYERSRDVKAYVLARASGDCEGCDAPAPFTRFDGSPYLEPHHIRRLSDGGPDHPASVIALCPNCHRRVHAGADGTEYNAALIAKMARLEPDIWDSLLSSAGSPSCASKVR